MGVSVRKNYQSARKGSRVRYEGRELKVEWGAYNRGEGTKQAAIHAAKEEHRAHRFNIGSKGAV